MRQRCLYSEVLFNRSNVEGFFHIWAELSKRPRNATAGATCQNHAARRQQSTSSADGLTGSALLQRLEGPGTGLLTQGLEARSISVYVVVLRRRSLCFQRNGAIVLVGLILSGTARAC